MIKRPYDQVKDCLVEHGGQFINELFAPNNQNYKYEIWGIGSDILIIYKSIPEGFVEVYTPLYTKDLLMENLIKSLNDYLSK